MISQIINQIDNYILGLYAKSRSILLDIESYPLQEINLDSVELYVEFIETSFEKPYNRLCSLSSFIEDDRGLLMDRMYPFALLSDQARGKIRDFSIQAIHLAKALDEGGIDEDFKTLITERRLVQSE